MSEAGKRLTEAAAAALNHPLHKVSLSAADALKPLASGLLPQEIIHTGPEMISIVTDIDGTDYILSLMEVPRQRERPTTN